MIEFFANPPWYVPTILAAVAVIFLFQGNNRQNRPLQRAGLAFAIASVALYLIAWAWDSPIEKVTRKTLELAESVDQRNWPAFAAILDPNVRFWEYNGAKNLTTGAEKSAERIDVKNIALTDLQVTQEPGAYIVTFRATADISNFPHRLPTDWRFHYGQNDLLLYRIDYIPNEKFGNDAVFSRLIKP